MSESLPRNWTLGTISDIADVNPPASTVAAGDRELVTFLPMAAVEELSGKIDVSAERPFSEVKKNFTRFREDDVLFAKITPSMENGKVAVARGLRAGIGCGTTEFHVIRPAPEVAPDYLRLFLVQARYRQEAKRNMQGAVGQQRVPPDFVRESPIPVAPAKEQQRIVSKIDELFSRIGEGEQALKRVEKLVERYRQSVLKAAVTGELTRDWRAARKRAGEPVESGAALLARILKVRRAAWETSELAKFAAKGKPPADDRWKQKYQEPAPPDTTDLAALPEGWVWVSLDMIADVTGGITVDAKRSAEGCELVPYLRVANVQRGYLDLAEVKSLLAPTERVKALALRAGDVLFNEGGDLDKLGRGWVWDGQIPVCIHQNHVFRARLFPGTSRSRLVSWYANEMGRSFFLDKGKQTTNLASISLTKLKALPVPVMSEPEAVEIESRASATLAALEHQVSEVRSAKGLATALRQSILKAAFSGQLVPQDPHDEPASKLLERIAAERAAEPSVRQRKKKSA